MVAGKRLLLDTHVWFRYVASTQPLRPEAVQRIDDAVLESEVYVSVISIWELAMLEKSGKLEITGGIDSWSRNALSRPGVALLPFSPRIVIESVHLPQPLHKDPADRFLVASARVERLTLVTADKDVLSFAKLTGLSYLRA